MIHLTLAVSNYFDVLIVYNHHLASSASTPYCRRPFAPRSSSETCNDAYAYLLERCFAQGLRAAFTTSADIIGPAACRSYWTFTEGCWHKNRNKCTAGLVFDKFAPIDESLVLARKTIFSNNQAVSYNPPGLFRLFFDKQKTYDKLAQHAIPTVSLHKTSIHGITLACQALAKLVKSQPNPADFGSAVIMKDRYGAGGNHVYRFASHQYSAMAKMMRQHKKISFVIQPFVKFDQGFVFEGQAAPTDIRLVYLGGEIVQTYIRRAQKGNFLCNEHQGGTSTYLTLADLPSKLLTKAGSIAKSLHSQPTLYALDFLVSNSQRVYFLEGNSGPGLNWDTSRASEAVKPKQLIRLLARELSLHHSPANSL